MSRTIIMIICFALLAANGVLFFNNLWRSFHGTPQLAYYAAFNFIGIGCMYLAVALLTTNYEN